MTLRNILEALLQEHPEYQAVQIVNDLNTAQSNFCKATGILQATSNLTLGTGLTYALPVTLYQLNDVKFYDTSGNELYDSDTLTWEVEQGNINFRDYNSEPLSAFPSSSIGTITLYYDSLPSTLSEAILTASPDIPSSYHQALIDKVSANYWARKGNAQLSSILMMEYKAAEQRAKIERRSNKTKTYNIQPVTMAGR